MDLAKAYLGRQPILNHHQDIIGYELLYRQSLDNEAKFGDPSFATAKVLMNTFSSLGVNQVLGNKLGFVNFGRELFQQDVVSALPKERVILEIGGDFPLDGEFIDRCKILRAEGYRFALDFRFLDEMAPLMEIADIIKLDMAVMDGFKLVEHVDMARRHNAKTLAKKVERIEQAQACEGLGVDYFQGYYFARPVVLEQLDIPATRFNVMDLLNQVMARVEFKVLSAKISRDVALSYKLLRYLNSAGMRRGQKIESIQFALVTLGYQQLYRWLTLLLFADSADKAPSALMTTAIVRGRLTELLGSRLPGATDELFVLGMFSLLDVLLNVPMEKLLRELSLPEDVRTALEDRSGPYAIYLNLAEALESCDWPRIQALSRELEIDQNLMNQAQLEAISYGEMFV